MSDKDKKPDKSGFSLQGEIKKRKTQEVQRAIEQKRVAEARGETPPKNDPRRTSQTTSAAPSTDPRRTSQTARVVSSATDPKRMSQTTNATPSADPRRTSQTARVVSSATDPKRASQTTNAAPSTDPRRTSQTTRPVADPRRTSQSIEIAKRATQTILEPVSHSRRNLLIAAGATVLAVMVLAGSFVLARSSMTSPTVEPTATPITLPMVSVDDVVNYLKKASVPISNLRQLPVVSTSWSASQEVQFDVQRAGNKATFIILSYPSKDRAVSDRFRVSANTKFKDWQVSIVSNVLLLASPDGAQEIKSEIGSHITSYLIAPYRSFLPTATLPPTATSLPTTSAGTTQATP